MHQLYIKQKVLSLSEHFDVTDANGLPRYTVQGSFMAIPKRFQILDASGNEISTIVQKTFSIMPYFSVLMGGAEVAHITKQVSLFRAKYLIDAQGLEVNGDWWDMNFTITQNGREVARVAQRWVSWGDSYEVTVVDAGLEPLIVAIVVAIDRVKESDDTAASVNFG